MTTKTFTTTSNFNALDKATKHLKELAQAEGYTVFTPTKITTDAKGKNTYTIEASNV